MPSRLVDISHPSFRRTVLLLLFVMSNTPVLPLALLLCAQIDGGHVVELYCNRESVGIQLRHSRTASDHHHSGWVAWFAANTQDSHHNDHQLTVDTETGWPSSASGKSLTDTHAQPVCVTSVHRNFMASPVVRVMPCQRRTVSSTLKPRGVRMQV